MPDPTSLRDSTEIVLPVEVASRVRDDLESRFALTSVEREGTCRFVGSPVAIKEAGEYLAKRGVSLP